MIKSCVSIIIRTLNLKYINPTLLLLTAVSGLEVCTWWEENVRLLPPLPILPSLLSSIFWSHRPDQGFNQRRGDLGWGVQPNSIYICCWPVFNLAEIQCWLLSWNSLSSENSPDLPCQVPRCFRAIHVVRCFINCMKIYIFDK